ncbi:DotA/TraY family protein [Thiotrichales bacterium 19S3-7]|nr:DotA/TraY family protein [Thiotrichales bacterium 19S3-7]MCF6801831.1 DotA/TraY family protein [Thiotrichales bacterium 19S3-11]
MSSSIWGSTPSGDQSQSILKEIFGVDVHTIISNNDPTTLFGYAFKYFNTGLLTISFAIFAFIIIVGTINTARDAQFLGRNWSGHWISLRAIFGTVCAVPFQTGYCVAQYLIFAMVTAGISFADYLWSNVVDTVTEGNVPPVVSTEVTNNIETYLATYMMSKLTQDMLKDPMFYSGNPAPCTSTPKTTTIKLSKDNSKTYEINEVTCNVSFSTPVTDSFVKSYANPLSEAIDGDSTPFKDYASEMSDGLSSWSVVDNHQYIQYQLNTIDWKGKFTINQMVDQPTQDDIQTIASSYGLSALPNYLTVNLVTDPDALNDQGAAIDNTADQIIKYIEANAASVIDNSCDPSDENSLCYKAQNYGWWDADQLYLDFDNSLSENLQDLYTNFSKLSTAASKLQKRTSIPIQYNKIDVHYVKVINDITQLNEGNTISFKPFTDEQNNQYGHIATNKDLKDYDNLDKSGTFTTSMQSVRDLFNQIIQDSSENDNTKTQTESEVNSLLVDGMEFRYAQYLYIIYSLANAAYSPYINNDSSDNTDKQNQANNLFKTVVLPTVNLFNFFYENNINFGATGNITDTSSVTDPAEKLLNSLFNKMGTNASSAEPGSMLYAIYNIGKVPDDKSGFASKNFSMMQNVQSVGMALIEGTINSMIGIFSNAKDRLDSIKDNAESQGQDLIHRSKVIAGTSWLIPGGLFQNTLSTGTNLKYAEAMFDVTMQLATFSLSLIWLPLILFVLSTIFSIGISFSLIIPLTPFILFWAGKTAWLLLVIEAMAAAPFVSLGLVYPEGHEVFGKAEPGIQICMNLVLRPVFMILGMICGIGLTYVVIQYSADGFHAITDSLLNLLPASDGTDAASYARGTFACMIIFLYATFLTMAFTKCFSLIYLIPDKVLQWIGNNHAERAGEGEIQEFKGAGHQYAQGAASAGGQSLSQGIDAEKNATQSYSQSSMEVAKSKGEHTTAIANDTTQAGQKVAETAKTVAKVMV